jgi:hypothetical protein
MIFDTRACELGEGALWHPLRRQRHRNLLLLDHLGRHCRHFRSCRHFRRHPRCHPASLR